MKLNSISTRSSLTVASAILFFGIITVILTYNFSTSQLLQIKTNTFKTTVAQVSLTIEESVSQSNRLVDSIAQNPLVISFLKTASPSANQVDLANKSINSQNLGQMYPAIYLINPDGFAILSSDESFINQNYSFRPYFQKAIAGEKYVDINFGITSKKLGFYFSSPVKNESEKIIGVAVVKMSPDYFDTLLKKMAISSMSDLLITDKHGVVVSSIKKERVLSSLGKLTQASYDTIRTENAYPSINLHALQYQAAQDIVSQSIQESSVFQFSDHLDQEEELMSVMPIKGSPFWITSEISLSNIYQQSKIIGLIISLMVSLSVLGTVIAVTFFLSNVLRPLKQISLMATEIGAGKYDQNKIITSNDEIGDLGRSIEQMASSLKRKYQQLESTLSEQSKSILQKSLLVENNNIALTNLLEDLEESKQDLEKFKLAVENASDHIVITDPDGDIIYANTAATRITGFSKPEMYNKKAGSIELWGGLMQKTFYKQLWQTIKVDKKTFNGQVFNHRKNGEKYTALSSISPILDQQDNVIYFIGMERDVTHEVEVDKMKTEFISLASHQLRTPLSAMRWFSEMLLDGEAGKLSKTQSEYVANISLANERMTALVNSLLNISRIESGRIIVDPEPTDLKSLVSEVIKEIDNKIKEKKQSIVLKISTKLAKINVDPKLIREVYKNLLTNSNKYAPVGGKISISIIQDNQEIISKVTDNGFGIPKKDQPKIFERFFRAGNIIKLETEGTGLGLYLAKAIVESSGGRIWFESEEGKGTTFVFSLPLAGVKAKKGEVKLNN